MGGIDGLGGAGGLGGIYDLNDREEKVYYGCVGCEVQSLVIQLHPCYNWFLGYNSVVALSRNPQSELQLQELECGCAVAVAIQIKTDSGHV